MDQFLNGPSYWLWFILGIALIVLEMVAPGVVFLWLGLAAIATGMVMTTAPHLAWEIQAITFAVLSGISIVAGRRIVARRLKPHDHPGLNARGSTYVGRSYVLAEPIINGNGKLVIDDTIWAINGPDLSAGARVRVTGLDNMTLQVVPD